MSTDRIEVACPACGQRTAVAPENLGRKGRCPACKEIFELKAPVKKKPAPTVQRTKAKPEADDVLGNFPGLGPPLPSAAPTGGDSLWNDFAAPPVPIAQSAETDPLTAAPPPLPSPQKPSLADDYMRRAREDKPVVQSMEAEPWYRFTTSWGSVIGGVLTVLGGIFMLLFVSIRLGAIMIIAGSGWFIQGLNYVFYYNWKDAEGR